MSYHDPRLPHGAQEVSRLADATDGERRFVEALRLWLNGPDAQAEVWGAFAARQGPARGREALRAFENFLEAVAEGATRKFWRHRVGCPCLGRDEALLAAAVRAGGDGRLELAYGKLAEVLRPETLSRAVAAASMLADALDAAPEPMEASASRARSFRVLH